MLLQMSLINPVLLEELIRNTPSDQLAQLQTCQIHLTKQLEMQTVDMMNSGQSGTLGSMLIAPLSPPTSEVNVASPVPYIPSIPPAISNYVKLDKGLNLAGTSKKESSSDSVLSSIIDKMKQVRIVPSSVLDGKNARHPSTEDMVAGAKPTTTSTAASSTSSASAGATTGKDGIKRYTAKPSRAAKRYDTQTSHSMARMRATSTSSKPEAEGATTTTTDTNHSQNVSDADTLPEESTDNNNNNNAKHEQSEQMRQVLDRLRQHVDQIMEARSLAREVTSNSNNSDDNNDGSGSSDIEQSSTMNKDKHDATQ
ncbi:hypothetical protein BDF22DRAFT_31956 [Syncephalis plumigaleata]|nr:hypothetical protein BDF22DRAFT_31956 [Syncephalis plumigaleata]